MGIPSLQTPDDIWQSSPEIIKTFLGIQRDNAQFCAEVEYILRKRIAEGGIEISAVTSRAKTLDSFLDKLQRKHYDKPFEQITDLAGARVVCLYRSDITKIAQIVRTEFEVIEDIDKLGEMGVDQFGYGARHFLVRLGRSSSGARYDDLKQLICEIQVRTVVQDAWAIIQHHMVYKRESQVPTQLQRRLNSLAGLFETVDDQFESIRNERETYIAGIRETLSRPTVFLENELNLDSFKEYLLSKFPGRPIEKWDGQARVALDALRKAGSKTLQDLETLLHSTAHDREELKRTLIDDCWRTEGPLPSSWEAALALEVSPDKDLELIPWSPKVRKAIRQFRLPDQPKV